MIKYKDPQGNIKEIEGRLFVCKDKNGKDVFEEDKPKAFGKALCKVIWSDIHRGWAVLLVENPKGVLMSLSSFYPKDIELIEDKND